MTERDLLEELDPWLARRCAHLAATLPGLDADEIYQQVVEEFLHKLGGWLQQAPTTSVVAQARELMGWCLMHVKQREVRARRRHHAPPADDDGDGLDALLPPVPPTDDLAAATVLARVRESTTPPCALCLLSLRLPAVVEPDDAGRAKAWKKGGANAVPRPLEEAWSLYRDGRDQPALVADDVRWKDHVGLAWYTEGPVPGVATTERAAAAAKVERYANRGLDDLRRALLEDAG